MTETIALDTIKSIIGEGGIIFDVGAMDGDYSELLAKTFKPQKIIAFEPTRESFINLSNKLSTLEKAFPDTQFKAINCAISDAYGHAKFHLLNQGGSNSLLELSDRSGYTRGIGLSEITQTTVPTVTIDGFVAANKIETVNFIKIDTQGSEVAVLRGASRSLSLGKIRALQVECITGELYVSQYTTGTLFKELESMGYKLITFHSVWPGLGYRLFQFDALFAHFTLLDG